MFSKISSIIRCSLNLKKNVTVANAARILSGPKVGSCRFKEKMKTSSHPSLTPFARPVVVSFEEDHAREEVLQKSGMLKGSNVYITEDLSR